MIQKIGFTIASLFTSPLTGEVAFRSFSEGMAGEGAITAPILTPSPQPSPVRERELSNCFVAYCLLLPLFFISACTPLAQPSDPYKFSAGEACHAPIRPVGVSDSGAISTYYAGRDKFMDCVNHEDPSTPGYQSDLDQSLAMIGDDQFQGANIEQQDTRGVLGRAR